MDTSDIVKGAIGLSKAALKIERADDETINSRKKICQECDQFKRVYTNFAGKKINTSKCSICGCFIGAKTLIKSEKCPEKKW